VAREKEEVYSFFDESGFVYCSAVVQTPAE